MRYLVFILLSILIAGCIPIGAAIDKDELVKKPIRQWSESECEMYLLEEMPKNYLASDQALEAVVFPCTPEMLLAYNWRNRQLHKISDDEFVDNTDRQARNCFGAYFDGARDRFVDHNGKFVTSVTQLDSLMVIILLESNVKGVNIYVQEMFRQASTFNAQAAAVSNYLGLSSSLETFGNVSQLLKRISIKGGGRQLSSPMYVRKDRGGYLLDEGSFLAMFPVTPDLKDYLQTHTNVDLSIDLGDRQVGLSMQLVHR